MDVVNILIGVLLIFLFLIFFLTYVCRIGPWSSIALASIFVLVFMLMMIEPAKELKKGSVNACHVLYFFVLGLLLVYIALYIIIVATKKNSI